MKLIAEHIKDDIYQITTDDKSMVWVADYHDERDERFWRSKLIVHASSPKMAEQQAIIELLAEKFKLIHDPLWMHR